MLVRNETPFIHACRVTSRQPPQAEMSVIVRGAFTLAPGDALTVAEGEFEDDVRAQGTISGHSYAPEDGDMVGAVQRVDDLADHKLNAEVMVVGACYAPGGKEVTECAARVAVGDWSKTVRVSGHRAWTGGVLSARHSEPAPFRRMPVDWAHAFGGEGFADNPVGKGVDGVELPNVELPGDVMRSPKDRPRPAALGPISPSWPPRVGRRGTQYGDDYAARVPFYAKDFDWRFFSQAPADQQLEGYLRGDERITLVNLHPKHEVVDSRLPGVRVRAFTRVREAAIVEVEMRLDTLVFDGDAGVAYLTWRGLCPVGEDDLTDVTSLLLVHEPLEARGDAAAYLAQLEAAEANPLGLDEADELRAEAEEKLARLDATLEAVDQLGAQGEGALADDMARVLTAAGRPDDEVAMARKALADAVATRQEHQPDGPDLAAAMVEARAAGRAAYPPPYVIPEEGQPLPIPPSRQRDGQLDRVRAELAAAEAQLDRAAEEVSEVGGDAGPALEQVGRARAELASVASMFDDPSFAHLRGPDYVEPGPGLDLSRQDLREADLRGRDLTGCNLREAQLGGADLRGARLTGADLSHAVLVRAKLEGADLSGTHLYLTNFTEASAPGVVMRGCRFDTTFLEDADFRRADLSECTGRIPMFERSKLEGASFAEADLVDALFEESELGEASFAKATLTTCTFIRCRMAGASFEDALISRSRLLSCSARGARFVGTRGERVVFLQSRLERADLRWSILPFAFFNEAVLDRARLEGANLREARFYRATLLEADLTQSNLMRVDMRKADLSNATLRRANLFEAMLEGAYGKDVDFIDANLERCRLPS